MRLGFVRGIRRGLAFDLVRWNPVVGQPGLLSQPFHPFFGELAAGLDFGGPFITSLIAIRGIEAR